MAYLILSGCTAAGQHMWQSCEGVSKDELMQELGTPSIIESGAENIEIWEYKVSGGSVMSYTLQNDVCIKKETKRYW